MRAVHYIAMDTHSYTTEVCVKTRANTPGTTWRVRTTIPALREAIASVPRPRHVTFEEGPLASWLYRNLKGDADELTVCDPRKNALVAKGGDKDDPIDAGKLNDLQIGGFLGKVHHGGELARDAFKQLVGLYHERVAHRVRQANKAIGRLRRFGVVVTERAFKRKADRPALVAQLPADVEAPVARRGVELLLEAYGQAVRHELELRRELHKRAKAYEPVVRFTALPGVGWVRAATFFAYLDTPWRFAGKAALWKYMGIGLRREGSGNGREFVSVELAANRALKCAILGAAESAAVMRTKDGNPFARAYGRWRDAGLTPRNARRNVARAMAAVMWGMWKNGGAYDGRRVGVAAREQPKDGSSCDGNRSDR
jgi:transposase